MPRFVRCSRIAVMTLEAEGWTEVFEWRLLLLFRSSFGGFDGVGVTIENEIKIEVNGSHRSDFWCSLSLHRSSYFWRHLLALSWLLRTSDSGFENCAFGSKKETLLGAHSYLKWFAVSWRMGVQLERRHALSGNPLVALLWSRPTEHIMHQPASGVWTSGVDCLWLAECSVLVFYWLQHCCGQ